TLKMNQLVKCVFVRVIDEQNRARHVVQPKISSAAPLDVAESNGNLRLNREIIIRDPVRMTDKDVVIPHTAHCQSQFVVKATRFTGGSDFATWKYVLGVDPAVRTSCCRRRNSVCLCCGVVRRRRPRLR